MANKDIPLGTRVKLSPESDWVGDPGNPTYCEGLTMQPNFYATWVYVRWDNGEWNTYKPYDSDLIVIGPLGEFGYKKVEEW